MIGWLLFFLPIFLVFVLGGIALFKALLTPSCECAESQEEESEQCRWCGNTIVDGVGHRELCELHNVDFSADSDEFICGRRPQPPEVLNPPGPRYF